MSIFNFFRLIIGLLVIGVVFLVGMLMHAVTWVIGRWDQSACDRMRWSYIQACLKVIWFVIGGPTTVIGLENVPTDRPVLFVGNHRSMVDIVLSGAKSPVPVGYVAKQELWKVPFLNVLMDDARCVKMDRKDPRNGLKAILQVIDYLKAGRSMYIFPEGTRGRVEGEMLPFHAGSFKAAYKAGVPIVPVTIVNMGDVFEDHVPWLKWVPVAIEYGAPIETAGMDRQAQKELPEKLRAQMLETYAKDSRLIGLT